MNRPFKRLAGRREQPSDTAVLGDHTSPADRAERRSQTDLQLGGDPVRPDGGGTVYGMNFNAMPEVHWRYGYFCALGRMLSLNVALYALLRRRGWT